MSELRDKFSLFVVPPNVTGDLHLGHALMIAIQDSLVRWEKLKGRKIEFYFGTDHAGISTEHVVKNKLANEGIDVTKLGKEAFLNYIWNFIDHYDTRIRNQIKKLDTEIMWEKNLFTLSDDYSKKITTSFVKLYKDDLIYRGNYPSNFCPNCETSLSDLEVLESEEIVKYNEVHFTCNDSNEVFKVLYKDINDVIFTDIVFSLDSKYTNYKLINPLTKKYVRIIEDKNLFNIEIKEELNDRKVFVPCLPYKNKNHYKKYPHLLSESQEISEYSVPYENKGVLELKSKVKRCERCSAQIREEVTQQWFMKTKELANDLIQNIVGKEVTFYPEEATEKALSWLRNIDDWCISRQITWGHPIPALHCQRCKNIIVSENLDLTKCPNCEGDTLVKSEEVLDTWFASSHWYFANYGWPEDLERIQKEYPLDLIETGHDILFFWVLRMMMLSLYHTGKLPSKKILLHGLVLDSNGKKMSKSRGNTINVTDLLDKEDFASDAIRLSLLLNCEPGVDIKIDKKQINNMINIIEKFDEFLETIDFSLDINTNEGNNDFSNDFIIWLNTEINNLYYLINENISEYKFNSFIAKVIKLIRTIEAYKYLLKPIPKELSIVLIKFFNIIHPFMPTLTKKYIKTPSFQGLEFKDNIENQNDNIFIPVIADSISKEMKRLDSILRKDDKKNIKINLDSDNISIKKFIEKYGELVINNFGYLKGCSINTSLIKLTYIVECSEIGNIKISIGVPEEILTNIIITSFDEFFIGMINQEKKLLRSVEKRLNSKKYKEKTDKLQITEDQNKKKVIENNLLIMKDSLTLLRRLGEKIGNS